MSTYDDFTQPVRLIIQGREGAPIDTIRPRPYVGEHIHRCGEWHTVEGIGDPGEGERLIVTLRPVRFDRAAIDAAQRAIDGPSLMERMPDVMRDVAHGVGAVWALTRAVGGIGLEAVGLRRGSNDAPNTEFAATKTRDRRGN